MGPGQPFQPPQGYPAQGVQQFPPPNVPPPQEGMVQVNPDKLAAGSTGASSSLPPPPQAGGGPYPPPHGPHGQYPAGPYPPQQPGPVAQGYPVYGPPPGQQQPPGYPGAPPPPGAVYQPGAPPPPGAMYTTGPPPQDDGKPSSMVCVAFTLFVLGIFLPLLWVVVALMPLCMRGQNVKTQLLVRRASIMASVALLVYLVLAIVLTFVGRNRWSSNNYSSGRRVCRDQFGNTFFC